MRIFGWLGILVGMNDVAETRVFQIVDPDNPLQLSLIILCSCAVWVLGLRSLTALSPTASIMIYHEVEAVIMHAQKIIRHILGYSELCQCKFLRWMELSLRIQTIYLTILMIHWWYTIINSAVLFNIWKPQSLLLEHHDISRYNLQAQ